MSTWLNSATVRAEAVDDWLKSKRQQSLQFLKQMQWPTRKTEAWKYVPINVWERADLASAANDLVAQNSVELIEGLNSVDLVIRNGALVSELSDQDFPEGVTVQSLSAVDEATSGWAGELFSSIKPQRHLFGLVNDVLAQGGVVIDVAAESKIERPIRIIYQIDSGEEAHCRLLVRVGDGATVSIIEQSCEETQISRSTAYAEYLVGSGAKLEHYRFALQGGDSMSVGGSHFDLENRAQLNSTLVGFGSALSRLDIDVNHKGEFAVAHLNAIYLLDGKELFDLHSTIEHTAANGTTEENVRGIVADNSRAIFNGRIHIHRDAQKTLAELNNRNLLLSDRAEINTKPELEIYADDVRCAHGATIAEIDKKALYYLRSRGVGSKQAQIMLNFGFINELVDEMPNAALAEWLRPKLKQRFAAMEVQ